MPSVTVYVYQWQTEIPVPQAIVTVTGYPSVLTNSSGVATIPNVTGDQTHTITTQKSGYLTDVRSPFISSRDYSTDVYLQQSEVPPDEEVAPPMPLWKFGIVAIAAITGITTVVAISKRKRR